MAIRTNEDCVKDIIETNASISLTPFIRAASLLVDWVADTCDVDGLNSAALLAEIECWLAAHFYAHRDQQYSNKKTGDASATFQGTTAMNLGSTQYGQTAMMLDLSNCLSKRSKEAEQGGKIKARLTWMGLEPENQDNVRRV